MNIISKYNNVKQPSEKQDKIRKNIRIDNGIILPLFLRRLKIFGKIRQFFIAIFT